MQNIKYVNVGIPVKTFEKLIPKLVTSKFSYVIYDYSKNGITGEINNYKEMLRIDGKLLEEERICLDCEKCWFKEKRIMIKEDDRANWSNQVLNMVEENNKKSRRDKEI